MQAAPPPTFEGSPAAYRLADNVVLLPVDDGSARLLDLEGSFYVLSQSASGMLRRVLSGGVDTTVAHIAAEHGVAPARVRGDLDLFLEGLLKNALIERPPARARRKRVRRMLARGISFLPLRLTRMSGRAGATAGMMLAYARVCTALFGWSVTVDAWRSALPPKPVSSPDQDDVVLAVDAAVRHRASRMPWITCKERALACWYILCARQIPATLIVGVQLYPLGGHCWCEVGARVLTDTPERCGAFLPVLRYAADGLIQDRRPTV
jgi:hypothetical protein